MAVLVRNGFKNYGTTPVLQNVNVTVEPGSIYGLLGASGTGKTTLLSCIVSLKKLDAGNITVFGRCPGQNPSRFVGYMPQEVSLGQFFTIAECFAYYGKVYGMTSKEISDRTEFLAKFLQLPDTSKLVSTLSGGEGRRVSLAVAVIHSPHLLVLDEPTVGLDPVLRQSIWEYMKHMTQLVKGKDKTTILITTHYIDEAKFCDSVGIMRRGRLIAEQNPKMLMDFYSSNSLGDTVLRLCKEDETKYNNKKLEHGSLDASLQSKFEDFTNVELQRVSLFSPTTNEDTLLRCDKSSDDELAHDEPIGQTLRHNANIVGALAKKKFLLQARYPLALIANLLLPVFQSILYNTIVGTPPFGLKMSYVSNDWNMQSEYYSTNQTLPEFCSNIYQSNSISGNQQQRCLTNDMSAICSFLNQFDENDIHWVPTSSVAESLKLVRNGGAIGYLEFPSNFTHHFKNRGIYRNFADNETIDGSALKVRMDLSGALSAAWLIDKIFNSYFAYVKETVKNCGLDPAQAELPLKFNPIYGELGGQNIKFMQPALIITVMFILANLPSIVWVIEKRLGIVDRDAVAGIKFGHIIASSLLSDTIIICGQVGILMFTMSTFYDMRVEGSWALAVTLCVLTSLSGLAFGYLCASFCSHEMSLIMTLVFFNSLLIISTGGIWPLEAVVSWYRIFCLSLPVSIPITAFRAIISRGWGVDHPSVIQGFVVAVGWIVIGFGISIGINRRKK